MDSLDCILGLEPSLTMQGVDLGLIHQRFNQPPPPTLSARGPAVLLRPTKEAQPEAWPELFLCAWARLQARMWEGCGVSGFAH